MSEQADTINAVLLAVNGPLYVRGRVEIVSPDGGSIILQDTRVALCRCGASQNKPFCDNSHLSSGFQAGDALTAESEIEKTEVVSASSLRITPQTNGSLHLEGAFDLKNAQGDRLDSGSSAWLCRCGGSHHKPFCDGTHGEIGFRTESDGTL
ncbi:MAG: CDGSH iron-sulfur domain-containing protein [Anaerolineae bacterium]